jgi:hypothetical protein
MQVCAPAYDQPSAIRLQQEQGGHAEDGQPVKQIAANLRAGADLSTVPDDAGPRSRPGVSQHQSLLFMKPSNCSRLVKRLKIETKSVTVAST